MVLRGVHGGNGFGDRYAEGEAILEFAMCFDLVANKCFTKETQKLVTYESGGVTSVVDNVLTRKNNMKEVKVKATTTQSSCWSMG